MMFNETLQNNLTTEETIHFADQCSPEKLKEALHTLAKEPKADFILEHLVNLFSTEIDVADLSEDLLRADESNALELGSLLFHHDWATKDDSDKIEVMANLANKLNNENLGKLFKAIRQESLHILDPCLLAEMIDTGLKKERTDHAMKIMDLENIIGELEQKLDIALKHVEYARRKNVS